jgi:hypothetical protein
MRDLSEELGGILFVGDSPARQESLRSLPRELALLYSKANGFIALNGGFHLRGLCSDPSWHSLEFAWIGESSFASQYPEVLPDDIPFAQDCFGDQFIYRSGNIFKLTGETGEVDLLCKSLDKFIKGITADPHTFLNLPESFLARYVINPGQLIHVYPPLCTRAEKRSFRVISATELISAHADFARQIRDVPDGGEINIKVVKKVVK